MSDEPMFGFDFAGESVLDTRITLRAMGFNTDWFRVTEQETIVRIEHKDAALAWAAYDKLRAHGRCINVNLPGLSDPRPYRNVDTLDLHVLCMALEDDHTVRTEVSGVERRLYDELSRRTDRDEAQKRLRDLIEAQVSTPKGDAR